ncbi:hypothetical protein ACIPUD_33455 [Bradyrhizobium sp. CAR08]
MRGTRSRTRRGAGKISGRERGDQEITTLGRGGSDTTAVAMAAALKAERREIIKEVDGICSADPRIVPDAKSLRRVDFAFLSEMCSWGAKILHFRSVELAQKPECAVPKMTSAKRVRG